jgi:hypothetical protein
MINSHVQITFSVLHMLLALPAPYVAVAKGQIYSNYLLHMTLKMTSAACRRAFRHAKSVEE